MHTHNEQIIFRRFNSFFESINTPNLTSDLYRTTFARNISAELFAAYGKSVGIFENYIPSSIKAVEASSAGISIYKHDPKGKVAQAYAKVTQEVLNHEN